MADIVRNELPQTVLPQLVGLKIGEFSYFPEPKKNGENIGKWREMDNCPGAVLAIRVMGSTLY